MIDHIKLINRNFVENMTDAQDIRSEIKDSQQKVEELEKSLEETQKQLNETETLIIKYEQDSKIKQEEILEL